MIKTKAVVVTDADRVEFADVELPMPGEGEVLVETAYTTVSPGTELRCMSGNAEAAHFPYIPGYCQTGTVVQCGPGVTLRPGTRVFSGGTRKSNINIMWGAHTAHAVKAADELLVLPDHLDLLDASVARLAAISLRGTRLALAGAGRKIAVVGLGPIGQLAARLCHMMGATVAGGDLLERRIDLLRAVGAQGVNTSAGIQEAFAHAFPEGADTVIDVTGVPALIPQIAALTKDKPWDDSQAEGPRYIFQCSYAGDVKIPFREAFMKEMSFYCPRDTQASDIAACIHYVAEGRLQVRDMIDEVYAPGQAPEAYARLADRSKTNGTVSFKWN